MLANSQSKQQQTLDVEECQVGMRLAEHVPGNASVETNIRH
jgi:hypothetical protein